MFLLIDSIELIGSSPVSGSQEVLVLQLLLYFRIAAPDGATVER